MCFFDEHAFTSRNSARHWPLADDRSSFAVMPDMSGSSTRMPYARSTLDLHSVQNLHSSTVWTLTSTAKQLSLYQLEDWRKMRKTNPSVNSIILRKHKVIATDNLNKQPNIFLNVIEVNSVSSDTLG